MEDARPSLKEVQVDLNLLFGMQKYQKCYCIDCICGVFKGNWDITRIVNAHLSITNS